MRNYSLKKIQILAFTGVAAIKGRGRTIHSFFKLPHRIPNKKKDYKKLRNNFWINALDIIVIDDARQFHGGRFSTGEVYPEMQEILELICELDPKNIFIDLQDDMILLIRKRESEYDSL